VKMKEKLLYLSFNSAKEPGVYKKINFQEKAISKLKIIVYRSYIQNNIFYINTMKVAKYNSSNKEIIKILRRLEIYFIFKKIKQFIYKEKISVLYIRYYRTGILFYNFIKYVKKQYKLKIILEIPTYPYDNEVGAGNFGILIDRVLRKKIYKYVDNIVTYSNDKVIWNIPCINISNGIDLKEVKIIEKKQHLGINFISVSNCSFWHEIDRFLYSLLQYKKNGGIEDLKFYIVGEGEETSKLKKIVDDNMELQDIVIFHGFKSGEELDEIYNNSDIALGSLGIHRLKLESVQPLKNREYCAKGLPFIIGFNDPNFKNKEYVYEVSYDDELIDIEKLIKWYRNLKISPEEIRKDAEEFTWDIQMKKVLDNI
jgi:hypothetical protein